MDNRDKFYGMAASFFSSKNCAHTSAEIAQQPGVWRELCGILTAGKNDITGFFGKVGDLKNKRIILAGAGSSAYAGEAVAYMLGKSNSLRCEAVSTTDIVSTPNSVLFPDVPTILVSFARSGNSPESAGSVRYARKIVKDLYEVSILCDGTSGLSNITRESEKSLVLVMPERSNDKGFAMTSSVSSMMLGCFALFNAEKLDEVCRDIRLLADTVEKESLGLTTAARNWAEKDYERLIVLGSGCCKGLAREAALKSMELTLGTVNTGYETSLGFRHGPKAVIKDDTLTIHFISGDPLTAKYDIDLLNEIIRQKKGNKIIVLSVDNPPPGADEEIVIPAKGYGPGMDLCVGISYLVFCQLLAMFKSLNLGIPTDNPIPSGELTRVVSGVPIYELES